MSDAHVTLWLWHATRQRKASLSKFNFFFSNSSFSARRLALNPKSTDEIQTKNYDKIEVASMWHVNSYTRTSVQLRDFEVIRTSHVTAKAKRKRKPVLRISTFQAVPKPTSLLRRNLWARARIIPPTGPGLFPYVGKQNPKFCFPT